MGMIALITTLVLMRLDATSISWIGRGIVLTIAVSLIAGLILLGWFGYQWGRAVKARTDKEVHGAAVTVITAKPDEQVYIRDKDHKAYWRRADIDPRIYANGHYTEPTEIERHNWHQRNLPPSTTQKQLLPGVVEGQAVVVEPDLLDVMTQLSQSYATIAGQRVGKSFQNQRVARHWVSSGIQPIVIAPKWDHGEWLGCKLFGGQLNYKRIQQGIRVINQIAMERHQSGMPFNQHPVLPVFFDDWTDIRKELGEEAESLVVKASTMYATVNIILYFMLHADTVNAWGVDKIGAALHQNFIKLLIEPGYNERGLIDRNRNVGYLLWPGQLKKDKKRVRLFTGMGNTLLLPDYVVQPEPTQERDSDAYFIELVQSGKSRNEAAQEAWGRAYAGNLVERGKRLLGEL